VCIPYLIIALATFSRSPFYACWGKIKLVDIVSSVFVTLKTILGSAVAGVLFFFAIVFALATNYWPTGLVVSAMFFVVGFAIIYFISLKPSTITQKLEVSGDMSAVALKCPNCGASVDAKQIRIVSGVPYATCPYCGHTFEVTEEPKW
jgi:predicted RNA-binding Zn-ribbon protein involved in translation (DUF1610 family)